MSTKKRVQFNEKKKVKKFKNDSDEDGGVDNDDEEFGEFEGGSKNKKHTLDSDEEDNSDEIVKLNRAVFKDIGQEAKTSEFDNEIKLTPFNMKDELDEGDFDKDGYYHWKKDKDEVKDAWLDNIDWANINSFKKSERLTKESINGGEEENDAEEDETEEKLEDEEEEEEDEGKEKSNQNEMLAKILEGLKPGETILKAIKRLGNSSKGAASSSSSSTLSASQRWLKKKQPQAATSQEESATAKADKETLEKLTGYCNYFISQGFYDIYEETYESIKEKLEKPEKKEENDAGFDIFADEVNEDEIKAASSNPGTSGAQKNLLEDSVVKWEYKLTNNDEDTKFFGPFTSAQMLEKSEQGEFKDTGVWCRKVGDQSTSFYNSKRIDFDLYT